MKASGPFAHHFPGTLHREINLLYWQILYDTLLALAQAGHLPKWWDE